MKDSAAQAAADEATAVTSQDECVRARGPCIPARSLCPETNLSHMQKFAVGKMFALLVQPQSHQQAFLDLS